MDVTIWTTFIDFKSPFPAGDFETISVNAHKTPVECFKYMAPRRQPTRYHEHFNAVFPMLTHYLLFHWRGHPGIQTADTAQLLQATIVDTLVL